MDRKRLQSNLLLKLVGMATLILHLHADFFQLLLRPSRHLVGRPSLPNEVKKLGKKKNTNQSLF